MADTRDRKLELIQQLLSKAESTTPAEAEALQEHAARLMRKYAIDQAVIDERRAHEGEQHEQIVTESVRFTKSYRRQMCSVASRVVNALGQCQSYRSFGKGRNYYDFYIVGFESDVAQAKLLIQSIQVQALVALRSWWNEVKHDFDDFSNNGRGQQRESFIVGYGRGVFERIQSSVIQVDQESEPGSALVLANRSARVRSWLADNVQLRAGRNLRVQAGAYGHGVEQGRLADVGGPGLTRGRGLTA